MPLQLVHTLSDIPKDIWTDLAPVDHPFLHYDFLKALEDTRCVGEDTGWYPHHLIAKDNDTIVGAMPLYLKTHSMGEYVFDHQWARAFESIGGQYYPKLVSCIPFTPVSAQRLLGDEDTQKKLSEGLKALTQSNGLSSAHILFPTEPQWQDLGKLGYLLRQDQQFWFKNEGYSDFEAFLAALSSNRRKVIRRERRDVLSKVRIEILEGKEITEIHLDHLYRFIENTYDKNWGRPYMTRDFFSAIPRYSMVLVLAYSDTVCIAGAINFKSSDTLYGRQWGCSVDIPFLHFEVCYYTAIDYAISKGLKWVEAGTQGGHKLMRGYMPAPVYSAHYISDPRLRSAVANALEIERTQVLNHMDYLTEDISPFKKLVTD
jgi:predicted N-acyltransferase